MEEVAEALGRKRRGLGPTGPVELPECAAESIKEGPGHGGPAWAQLDAARAPGARRR